MHRVKQHGIAFDVAPLPHPSGASTWPHTEPGKTLLPQALALIDEHPAWRQLKSAAHAKVRVPKS
jgi:uracil-DNA glycosylase